MSGTGDIEHFLIGLFTSHPRVSALLKDMAPDLKVANAMDFSFESHRVPIFPISHQDLLQSLDLVL